MNGGAKGESRARLALKGVIESKFTTVNTILICTSENNLKIV
jgi:hypothetical protein